MNSVRWKNLSLKYQRFTPSGGKNIGIRKSAFVTKTQFLSRSSLFNLSQLNLTFIHISGEYNFYLQYAASFNFHVLFNDFLNSCLQKWLTQYKSILRELFEKLRSEHSFQGRHNKNWYDYTFHLIKFVQCLHWIWLPADFVALILLFMLSE